MSTRWRKIAISCLLTAVITACTLPTPAPVDSGTEPPATASPAATEAGGDSAPTPTDVPVTMPELGQEGNPILLALPPAQILQSDVISNGQQLAAMLSKESGYQVAAVSPSSYTDLIEALRIGNAHIAALPPYAIVKAYQQDAVTAAFASQQDGAASIGAQFIARSDQFTAYFDPNAERNFKDLPDALTQFSGKKPCWTTTDSLSGYRVPAGILGWFKIPVQEGAFMQSQYSVVRALELGSVCDFGATYIDARTFPVLMDQYPHILDDVAVIWQIPPVIPYDGIFLSSTLPSDVQLKLDEALQNIALTGDGQTLLKSLYGMEDLIPVKDNFYTDFARYITASGADWENLVH